MSNTFPPDWLEKANRLALIARQLSTTIHDVNNMLQVISGHAELLVTAPDANDVMLKRGEMIGSQAQRATLALAELADFAKDVSDRHETVELRAIAARALAMRAQALARLRITAAVEGDEVRVRGNARRLLQIALNLIANAEGALTRRMSPSLRVAVARVGHEAQLIVEDSSAGPAPATDPPKLAGEVPHRLGIGVEVSQWLAAEQSGSLGRISHSPAGSQWRLSLPAV